jgi:4-aminobutyrate aminotransferase
MKQSMNETLQARKAAATPRGISVMATFFAQRAQGSELWDVEGRRFIDFAGGIAVLNTGHAHPAVIEAMRRQLDLFTHSCYQVVPYESYIALAEKLNRLTPGEFAKKTAFFSTGAEAIENTIKIARSATRRSGLIAFSGAFHGRTLFAVGLTGKVHPYKAGFGPVAPEVYHVPFPAVGADLAATQKHMDLLFKSDIDPARVAAIVFEPVQGEGGFNPIQPEAVRWLRRLCDEHGILLIADEIQTGFGRTGKLFAMEHFGVAPDLMAIAKSLAGGMPLSAVTGRAEVMDAPPPGGLGGTYAGNPVAIAAAHAVIDLMQGERLPERAAALGAQLKERLLVLRARQPRIADVRGLGAMVACEFRDASGAADAAFTRAVQQHALANGLILLTCGNEGNALRFLFPLTIPQALFDEALAILEQALLHA